MTRLVLHRTGQAAVVLVLASIVIFAAVHLLPGDPAAIYAGSNATPDVIASVHRSFGLDQPLPVQYIDWLANVLRGNLGVSFVSDVPVSQLIGQTLPVTLALGFATIAFAVFVGLGCGVVAARNRGRWIDRLVAAYNVVGLGVPNFWLGFVLLIVFAAKLRWFPVGGYTSASDNFVAWMRGLVLPAVALGAYLSAWQARFVRNAMLDVLAEDYVRTARSKGLGETAVLLRHALRNIMVPVLTVIGIQAGRVLSGAVVIETVFSIPGMGRLMVQSVLNRDYAVLQALLIVFVFTYLIINFLVDIANVMLDPRLRSDVLRG